jgi:hypothetical protein
MDKLDLEHFETFASKIREVSTELEKYKSLKMQQEKLTEKLNSLLNDVHGSYEHTFKKGVVKPTPKPRPHKEKPVPRPRPHKEKPAKIGDVVDFANERCKNLSPKSLERVLRVLKKFYEVSSLYFDRKEFIWEIGRVHV